MVTDNNNRNNSSQSNIKINQSDTKDTNFEYEDNEWDLGNLIFLNKISSLLYFT